MELDQTHEPLSSKDRLEWIMERVNESAEQIRSNEGLIALVLVTEDETQPTIVRALRRTSATVIVVSVVSNLVRLFFFSAPTRRIDVERTDVFPSQTKDKGLGTWMQLCLLLGLLKRVGPAAQFTALGQQSHSQWSIQDTYHLHRWRKRLRSGSKVCSIQYSSDRRRRHVDVWMEWRKLQSSQALQAKHPDPMIEGSAQLGTD